jgi:hypothetical protein
MAMKLETAAVRDSSICSRCGSARCSGQRKLDIAIKHGDVRRASRMANGVFDFARGPCGFEHGVIFMTAILLIERLAETLRCDPQSVLHKIMCCFELKAEHMTASDDCN